MKTQLTVGPTIQKKRYPLVIRYRAGDGLQANLETQLATLDPAQEWDVAIDGVVQILSAFTLPSGVNLLGFEPDHGLYFGPSGYLTAGSASWSQGNRGSVITSNITEGDSYFVVPAGMTLDTGDVVVISGGNILSNTVSNSLFNTHPAALRVVSYVETISSVDYAFLTKPIPFGCTSVSQTFTADAGTDLLTYATDLPAYAQCTVSSTTTLPAGLTAGTTYWIVRASATTAKLATSYANAQANTTVNITDTGTGTHTIVVAPRVILESSYAANCGLRGMTITTDETEHNSVGFMTIYGKNFSIEDCVFESPVPAATFMYGETLRVRANKYRNGCAYKVDGSYNFIFGLTNDVLVSGNSARGWFHGFTDCTTASNYAGCHYVTVHDNEIEVAGIGDAATGGADGHPALGIGSHPSNWFHVISNNRVTICSRDVFAMSAGIGTTGNYGKVHGNVVTAGGNFAGGKTDSVGAGIDISGYRNEVYNNTVIGFSSGIVIDVPPAGTYKATANLGHHIIRNNIIDDSYYASIQVADNGGVASTNNVIMGNVCRGSAGGATSGAVIDILTTGNQIVGNYLPKATGASSVGINSVAETAVTVVGNTMLGYTNTSKTGFAGTNAAALATLYAAKNYIDP